MFVPVLNSSPSLADLSSPSPRASIRHTSGCNPAELTFSPTRICSSTLSSGLLPAWQLVSRVNGD